MYKTQSADTTIAAELVLFDLWRSHTPTQRAISLNHNTRNARSTAWHIAKTTLATENTTQQIHYFLQKVLDSSWIDYLEIQGEMQIIGAIEEALVVARILESLEIPYLISGSVASGIWGEMRYTQDIDLVADFQASQIDLLMNAFSSRFYISEIAIREALQLGISFNLIDNQTGWKIDIFVLTADPFRQSIAVAKQVMLWEPPRSGGSHNQNHINPFGGCYNFQRRRQVSVDDLGQTLIFSSPEDLILQKLLWYRMTQKQSTQQWRDILGILKLQQPRIDLSYLKQWAEVLQLSTELEEALSESS